MNRRILAVVIAIVASVAGHALVFTGGVELLRAWQQFDLGSANPVSVLSVIAGIALIAVAALTIVLSSAGVILLGTVHIVFGLLTVVLPFNPMGDRLSFSPTVAFIIALGGFSQPLSDGLIFSFTIGTGILTGVVFLVAGLAARRRAANGGATAIVVSIVVSLVGLVGILVAISGGSTIYRSMFAMLRGTDLLGVALLLLGSVLLAAAVVTVRWSSAGVIVLGAVVTIVGVVWQLLPQAILSPLAGISRDLVNAMVYLGPTGLLPLLGVVLVAVGFGAHLRARRTAARVASIGDVSPESLAPTAYASNDAPAPSV